MTFTGEHNETYITSRELGKGGEGSVYELQRHPSLVLKLYNDPLTPDKIRKLAFMVSMRNPGIEAYSAWPQDIVRDTAGKVVGFVMKKLAGYVPLHHVFSPMDRKKMFPDKGYNFLVHVARNIATAFHKLHESGLVVGDVNEGNILVSATGLAVFIDCDSFQVKGENEYYFCEVGVPRYTPPELLRKTTFEKVVRTTNTDNFSLAVLLFQLLFLGRHPFAGKHKTAADIDEETAIKQKLFAYSLDNKKKLSPPPDSFPIANLPDELVTLFHRAFEQDERPEPREWVKALDGLLTDMATCTVSRIHTYPARLSECPWCAFRKNRGIMYFLDDSYLQANAVLGNIEQFINGFRADRPIIKKLNPEGPQTALTPSPPAKKLLQANKMRKWVSFYLCIAGIAIAFFIPVLTAAFFAAAFAVYKRSGWTTMLTDERTKRANACFALRTRLTSMIREYESPGDMGTYNAGLETLQVLINNFKNLPAELEKRRKLMEETMYNDQLDDYLRRFDIDNHTIPSIGPAKKSALYKSGIYTAAHITLLATVKVPGIGPALEQVLLAWRRQMSAGFVYIPDNYRMNIALQRVNEEVMQLKMQLESQIRKEYQTLNFLKLNIQNRAAILENQIYDLRKTTRQAEADMDAFKKIAA